DRKPRVRKAADHHGPWTTRTGPATQLGRSRRSDAEHHCRAGTRHRAARMIAATGLLAGPTLDQYFFLALGLAVAALGFFVLRQSPKLALGFALVVLCFAPIWIGIRIGPNGNLFLTIASAVAVL